MITYNPNLDKSILQTIPTPSRTEGHPPNDTIPKPSTRYRVLNQRPHPTKFKSKRRRPGFDLKFGIDPNLETLITKETLKTSYTHISTMQMLYLQEYIQYPQCRCYIHNVDAISTNVNAISTMQMLYLQEYIQYPQCRCYIHKCKCLKFEKLKFEKLKFEKLKFEKFVSTGCRITQVHIMSVELTFLSSIMSGRYFVACWGSCTSSLKHSFLP